MERSPTPEVIAILRRLADNTPRGGSAAWEANHRQALILMRNGLSRESLNLYIQSFRMAPGAIYQAPPLTTVHPRNEGGSYVVPWPENMPLRLDGENSLPETRDGRLFLNRVAGPVFADIPDAMKRQFYQEVLNALPWVTIDYLNEIVRGIWNHDGPAYQYQMTMADRARAALPTLVPLETPAWEAKVIPLLNSQQAFDNMDLESQELFLRAALRTRGFTEEQWVEFNDIIIDVWIPTAHVKPDVPLLVPGQKRGQPLVLILKFVKNPVRIVDDRLQVRDQKHIPVVLSDYRMGYISQLTDIDPGGFFYKAFDALDVMIHEDASWMNIFLAARGNSRMISIINERYYGNPELNSMVPIEDRIEIVKLVRQSKLTAAAFRQTFDAPDMSPTLKVGIFSTLMTHITSFYNTVGNPDGDLATVYTEMWNDFEREGHIPYALSYFRDFGEAESTVDIVDIIGEILVTLFDIERGFPGNPFLEEVLAFGARVTRMRAGELRGSDTLEEIGNFYRMVYDLGRRCLNTHDPGYPDMLISSLPDYLYIRMSNGMCWEIESLTEWIRYRSEGRNSSEGLERYPTVTLWETDEELERIMTHPVSIKNGFRDWMEAIKNAELYAVISDRTLEVFERTIQLFVLRGEYFQDRAEEELMASSKREDTGEVIPADPREVGIFRQQGRNFYALRNAARRFPENSPEAALYGTVVGKLFEGLRSKASKAFYEYYGSLSAPEKEALEKLRPGFQKDTHNCTTTENISYRNRLCQFVFARVILGVLNRIRNYRGMPAFVINTEEVADQ